MRLELLPLIPQEESIKKCEKFINLFKEYNSHTNLMSKNDLSSIFEKHIVDSLSIAKAEEFTSAKKILDIGTGGGFPSIPITIFFSDKEIVAVDSIGKKIRFIEQVKQELNLKNLTPICSRIENLNFKPEFDIVTSRALASLKDIINYALPYLKKDGVIIAYKSKSAQEELIEAKELIKKKKLTHIKTVSYTLECGEKFERCLIVLKKTI